MAAGSGWDDRLRGQGMSQVLEGVLGDTTAARLCARANTAPGRAGQGSLITPQPAAVSPK